jgi:hypothetical protein
MAKEFLEPIVAIRKRLVRKAALLEPNLRAACLVLTPEAHPDLAGAGLEAGREGGRTLRSWRCC